MYKLNNFIGEIFELEKETITTLCGPPSCGKTTLCFQFANLFVENKKNVIYIDTEGGFSPERLKQINPSIDLKKIFIFSPKDFEKQQKIVLDLKNQIKKIKDVGLIIIDSLVMLYRLKLGDSAYKVNLDLAKQLKTLTEISRVLKIPILITNQVYQNFDTKEIKYVGGNLIEYWSKTIVEIKKDLDVKSVILKKHKFKKEGICKNFEIKNLGLMETKKRSFNFFKK